MNVSGPMAPRREWGTRRWTYAFAPLLALLAVVALLALGTRAF